MRDVAALDYTFERREILARREEREEGYAEGKKEGIEFGIKAFIQDKIDDGIDEEVILRKLVKRFDITKEEAFVFYNNVKKQQK